MAQVVHDESSHHRMLSLLLSFFTGVCLTFLFLYFGGFIGVVVVPGEVKVDRVPREIGVQAVEGEIEVSPASRGTAATAALRAAQRDLRKLEDRRKRQEQQLALRQKRK